MIKSIHTIFYSWQSDLPKETNLNAIRQTLREASSLVENELNDTRLELDEATRNTAGSPNIPATIFNKIESCDIFICDLTTINQSGIGRKTANPNVLIELGYAIANLGWERIIMLFNSAHGIFPNDLPFDIERHRCVVFKIKDKADKAGKNELSQVLKLGIRKIIETPSLKPHERRIEKPEHKKRRLDINNLKWVLQSVHIPTFDLFFEEMPDRILKKIFFFKEGLSSTIDSNVFYLYDKKLLKLINDLIKNLNESLSYAQHYSPEPYSKYYKFIIPFDEFRSDQDEKDFIHLMKVRTKLIKSFKDFLTYIRIEYLEIDLNETDIIAYQSYRKDNEN